MKNLILLSTLLFTLNIALCQKISNIDYDEIEENVKDSTSIFYYPKLTGRLLNHDTTLTKEDYKHLYYGNIYTEGYNPYGRSKFEDKFLKYYEKEKFEKAIPIGKKILLENPIDINMTFKILVCYHYLDIKDSARIYADKYYSLLDVIYSSGDGKSTKTAYVVIKINDEYQILSDMDLKCTGQALLGEGPTDVLSIDTKGQKKKKGAKKIKEVYFNVSKPFEHMGKLMQED